MFKKKAFTLIELLVVIAIIGVLATISIIALSNARAKSRDAKRAGDMKQIQTALEMFFNDNNRYPTLEEFSLGSIFFTTTDSTSTYMQIIPSAPTPADGSCAPSENTINYQQTENGNSYTISFCLGNTTGTLTAGPKCLTPGGIVDVNCSGGGGGELIAACSGSTPGGSQCSYGGLSYNTITVGSQIWLKENLNYGAQINRIGAMSCVELGGWGPSCQTNNAAVEKYCYNDDSNYCTSDGGLYEWAEAMALPYDCSHAATTDNGDDTYTISCPLSGSQLIAVEHQGLCPSGWHVPNETDWHTLEFNLADDPDVDCDSDHGTGDCLPSGYHLKAASGWGDSSDNLSGFTALPVGFVDGGDSLDRNNSTIFIGSVPTGTDAVFERYLMAASGGTLRAANGRIGAMSLRCIRN